jgi:hypothetical protein
MLRDQQPNLPVRECAEQLDMAVQQRSELDRSLAVYEMRKQMRSPSA